MNNPDLSRWQRSVNYVAPFQRLLAVEKRRTTSLREANDALVLKLAAVAADRDALKEHYEEAVRGRERAMDVAKELGGAPRWNEVDAVFLAELDIEAP